MSPATLPGAPAPIPSRYPPIEHDPLGDAGFEIRSVPLGEDDEGPFGYTLMIRTAATFQGLVGAAAQGAADEGATAERVLHGGAFAAQRFVSAAREARPEEAAILDAQVRAARPFVLYIHGWSDYFFQVHVADFFNALGFDFCAVDLRKCGRSLRDGQTATSIDSLADYAAEIEGAIDAMRGADGAERPPLIYAHSAGALTAVLWAADHPGRAAGLIGNSPWLEFHGGSALRTLFTPLARGIADRAPRTKILPQAHNFYARAHRRDFGGQWDWHEAYKPARGMPFPANTMAAVLDGHARVAAGLQLDIPVLVATSSRTSFSMRWRGDLMHADTVLDVRSNAQRATQLGEHVSVVTIPGATHDIALSSIGPRRHFFQEIGQWLLESAGPAMAARAGGFSD